MKIYVETPVKVEKGDFLVVDDVHETNCHCGTAFLMNGSTSQIKSEQVFRR